MQRAQHRRAQAGSHDDRHLVKAVVVDDVKAGAPPPASFDISST